MDRGARHGIVNRREGKGAATLLLLVILLVEAGCQHMEPAGSPPSPPAASVAEEQAGDNTVPAAEPVGLPPSVSANGAAEEPGASPADAMPSDVAAADNAAAGGPEAVASPQAPLPEAQAGSGALSPRESAPPGKATAALKPKPPAAASPVPVESPKVARDASLPGWAMRPEELAYRVDFIGITMGYARFRYQGKVIIDGKPTYHLSVRAWTSGILSFIYPINETIDYYLDAETIAPIRQESTRPDSEKDDVALYDQETGKITVRYRQSGKIRKEVTTIPSVYDPVSVAYYFRWRDLGAENRPRNVYGGRKLYQISSRILGNERIHTEHGDVDTIVVLPLIRRDGKPDDKGDLKVWFSNDERRVPVRLYAKFHKIKDWTLVGELVPPAGKAGG